MPKSFASLGRTFAAGVVNLSLNTFWSEKSYTEQLNEACKNLSAKMTNPEAFADSIMPLMDFLAKEVVQPNLKDKKLLPQEMEGVLFQDGNREKLEKIVQINILQMCNRLLEQRTTAIPEGEELITIIELVLSRCEAKTKEIQEDCGKSRDNAAQRKCNELADILLNEIFGGHQSIWVPDLGFVGKAFNKMFLPKLWTQWNTDLSTFLYKQFSFVFAPKWKEQFATSRQNLQKVGGVGSSQEQLYEKTCESLAHFIRKKTIEEVPKQAYFWTDFIHRLLEKPDIFNKEWFAKQIASVQSVQPGSSIDHFLSHVEEQIAHIFIDALARNIKDRKTDGPIQDFLLAFIDEIDPLARSIDESAAIQDIVEKRYAIRKMEIERKECVQELEKLEKKEQLSPQEEEEKSRFNGEIDLFMEKIREEHKTLLPLYEPVEPQFAIWKDRIFSFLHISETDFPIPPEFHKTFWKNINDLVTRTLTEFYGDFYAPFYVHIGERSVPIHKLEGEFVALFSKGTGQAKWKNLCAFSTNMKERIHAQLASVEGKDQEAAKDNCRTIAHAINRLMPDEKFDDQMLGDWVYLLLSDNNSSMEKVWNLFDDYIDAAVKKMGYHFAKKNQHRDRLFTSEDDVYRMIVSDCGTLSGTFLREEGLLEREEEFKELRGLLQEFATCDKNGQKFPEEKQKRIDELKEVFCKEMLAKMNDQLMKNVGLEPKDIPLPTSFTINEVLQELIFEDVYPSWLILEMGDNLLQHAKATGMIRNLSDVIRKSKERMRGALALPPTKEAEAPPVMRETSQFALDTLEMLFEGHLGAEAESVFSKLGKSNENFATNLRKGYTELQKQTVRTIKKNPSQPIQEQVLAVMAEYVGQLEQLPPAFGTLRKKLVRIIQMHAKAMREEIEQKKKPKEILAYMQDKNQGVDSHINALLAEMEEAVKKDKESTPDLVALKGALNGLYEVFIQSVVEEKGNEGLEKEKAEGKSSETIVKEKLDAWGNLIYREESGENNRKIIAGLAAPVIDEAPKETNRPPLLGQIPLPHIPFVADQAKAKRFEEEKGLCRQSLLRWRKDFFQHLLALPDCYTDQFPLFVDQKKSWEQRFIEEYDVLNKKIDAMTRKEEITDWKELFREKAQECMKEIAEQFHDERGPCQERIQQQYPNWKAQKEKGTEEQDKKPVLSEQDIFALALLGQEEFANVVQTAAVDPEGGYRVLMGTMIEAIADDATATVYEKVAEKEAATQEQVVVDLFRDGINIFTKHAKAHRTGVGKPEVTKPLDSEQKKALMERILHLAGLHSAKDLTKFAIAEGGLQNKFWEFATGDLGTQFVDGIIEAILEPETIDQMVLAVLEKLGEDTAEVSRKASPQDAALNEACGGLLLEMIEHVHLPWGTKFLLKRKGIQRFSKQQIGKAVREAIGERFLVKSLDEILGSGSGKLSAEPKSKAEREKARIQLEKDLDKATKKFTRHFRTRRIKKIFRTLDRILETGFRQALGKPGLALYRGFRAIFKFIFVTLIATLLSYLIIPITYAVDRYTKKRVDEVRAMLKKVITEQLVRELAESAIEKFQNCECSQ